MKTQKNVVLKLKPGRLRLRQGGVSLPCKIETLMEKSYESVSRIIFPLTNI